MKLCDRDMREYRGGEIVSRWLFLLVCVVLVLGSAGCSKSNQAKIEEAQRIYTNLVARHNEVVNAYAESRDESLSKQLDEMEENLIQIGNVDLKECSEEEIDTVITGLKESLSSYDEIFSTIEASRKLEEEQTAKSVALAIRNNTGINLLKLFVYPAGKEDRSNNLVEELGELGGYATVNLTEFYLEKDVEKWEILGLNDKGDEIIRQELELLPYLGKSATVQMDFNFDRNEGWITVTAP